MAASMAPTARTWSKRARSSARANSLSAIRYATTPGEKSSTSGVVVAGATIAGRDSGGCRVTASVVDVKACHSIFPGRTRLSGTLFGEPGVLDSSVLQFIFLHELPCGQYSRLPERTETCVKVLTWLRRTLVLENICEASRRCSGVNSEVERGNLRSVYNLIFWRTRSLVAL